MSQRTPSPPPTVLSTAQVLAAVALALQTPGMDGLLGVPVLLWGPPGIGKTARVNLIAEALAFEIVTVLASLRGPEDFLGLPMRVQSASGPVLEYAPPGWAAQLLAYNPDDRPLYAGDPAAMRRYERALARRKEQAATAPMPPPGAPPGLRSGPPGLRAPGAPPASPTLAALASDPVSGRTVGVTPSVLFLDEITTAGPSTMSALLRTIHERVVGDIYLPSTTTILAAANPPEQAAGDNPAPLKPPIANRFIHLEWPDPSVSEWAAWLRAQAARVSAGSDAAESAAVVAAQNAALRALITAHRITFAGWADAFSALSGSVEQVLGLAPKVKVGTADRSLFYAPPAEGEDEAYGRAWPSPRSWEFGLRAYASAMSIGADGAGRLLLAGAVGAPQADAFLRILADVGLPSADDVLADAASGRFSWTPKDAKTPVAAQQFMRVLAETAVKRGPASPQGAGIWPLLHHLLSQGQSSHVRGAADILRSANFRLGDALAQDVLGEMSAISLAAGRAAQLAAGKLTGFLEAR